MSVTIVQGSEVELMIYDDGISDYKLLGCATGVSMEKSSDTIEVTTFNTGKQREFRPTFEHVTGRFEGLITLDENPLVQYDELMDLMGAEQALKLRFTNQLGDTLTYQVRVLITNVSMTASEDDFAGFTVSFIRNGNWVKTKNYNKLVLDNLGNPVLDSSGHFVRG